MDGLCVFLLFFGKKVESEEGHVSDGGRGDDEDQGCIDLLHRGDCLNRGMCDEVSKFLKRWRGC